MGAVETACTEGGDRFVDVWIEWRTPFRLSRGTTLVREDLCILSPVLAAVSTGAGLI